MLTRNQLLHFAEKGWVIEEEVFSVGEVSRYKAAVDRHVEEQYDAAQEKDKTDRFYELIVNADSRFRECLLAPNILEAHRQITGTELRYLTSWMILRCPHPDRKSKKEELTQFDTQGWHRDLRPKWGIFPHDNDKDLINSAFNNSMVLLTDIGDGDGGTLLMDGSHKVEGDWPELLKKCPVSQVKAASGSVVYFSETLMHRAVPIVSDKTRYAIFVSYGLPWFKIYNKADVPAEVLAEVENEEWRNILEGWDVDGYHGQYSVVGCNQKNGRKPRGGCRR